LPNFGRSRNEVTAITADTALAPGACGHGAACHDGTESSAASAPANARAWLLVEHLGPWPEEAPDADLPAPLRTVVDRAVELGVRIQLIRRPGRRVQPVNPAVFTGWTAGETPWLRRHDLATAGALAGQLDRMAEGQAPPFGLPVPDPLLLVCAHGRRDVCCARLGGPLARRLARTWPAGVWETTHVGGHRFAANLVILPHGLYYGPVAGSAAEAAVTAYQRGEVALDRYRGRAGQPEEVQRGDHLAMQASGDRSLSALS
jgi:hypothetical protein